MAGADAGEVGTPDMTTRQHPGGQQPPRSSIFREAALSHYRRGADTIDWAPVRRPSAVRWLWLALAAAVASAIWVGAQPIPAFTTAELSLLPHDCDGVGQVSVVATDASLHASLAPGRRVLLEHADPTRGTLVLTSVASAPLPADRIAAALDCPVDVTGLPHGPHAVAVAEAEDASVGALPVARARGQVEVGQRRLVSLLPLWPAPEPDRSRATPADEAGGG